MKRLPTTRGVTRTVLAGTVVLSAYLLAGRPWQLHWGATEAEVHRPLPGDDLVPDPKVETTRAITLRAAPAEVWSWLVQIGYQRGGFYSYDRLENLIGLRISSADRILPELQKLRVGDSVKIGPETPLRVAVLDPARALVLHVTMDPFTARLVDLGDAEPGPYLDWTWAFVLDKLDANTTRLIVRVRGDYQPRWIGPLFLLLVEPIHFLMERQMLLGIKQRAEAAGR